MKKAIISIIAVVLLLCLAACTPVPEETSVPEETLPPSTEELITPSPTPVPSPRTAEEVLPPAGESIFPDTREGIYMSSVSAGPDNMVVILADGSLVCRGEVGPGKIGEIIGDGFYRVLDTEENFNYVFCTQFDSFMIDEAGDLWGSVMDWGNITGASNTDPRPRRLLTDVQMASCGGGTYLALRKDGTVWMWGAEYHAMFGKEVKSESYSISNPLTEPVKVLENVIYSYFGYPNAYAIKEDNSLWVWGAMGRDPESGEWFDFDSPVCVMEDVKYVHGSLVIKTDGTLWEIDTNWLNMFDAEGNALHSHVKAVEIMENVKFAKSAKISYTDRGRFYAIKNDGSLWTWGDNLGLAFYADADQYVDKPVKIMDDVVYMDTCEQRLYALKSNGELWEMSSAYGLINYSSFSESTLTEEEFSSRYLPHKILDGVLVK